MFDTLTVETEGSWGKLTLNRPDKLNPLSTQALQEIAEAARWFDEQREVKAVLVRGAGRAFCAGADLAKFAGPQELSTREAADIGRRMADAMDEMRAVSVAAIHGWCIGGGVVLASACDLRIAADDARFRIPEVDLGIPLTWGGIPRLVREIGPAMTKELVMTCREFGPDEALRMGFLNRVVPAAELTTVAEETVKSLAAKAAHAVLSTKAHVNAITAQAFGTGRSWADADALVTAFQDPECDQARRDYLAKRLR